MRIAYAAEPRKKLVQNLTFTKHEFTITSHLPSAIFHTWHRKCSARRWSPRAVPDREECHLFETEWIHKTPPRVKKRKSDRKWKIKFQYFLPASLVRLQRPIRFLR
ncbi:hypothetical protein EVAR_84852_1 [Eumeta japonica]|uniref:Uncharacterized protein n=1 Tax=Eumeta variegata TaxID=151549 RepID=A0A4C1Z5E7_EUMVA|nr:hypothetical protein EVAR_84852_1 [Eumeta japonica]